MSSITEEYEFYVFHFCYQRTNRILLFQVFHICEGGKKISFLCPNGTIFQQSDLICDWWFRVNCNASPGHYAESSEVLSRAQKRPLQGNENSGAEYSIKSERKKLPKHGEQYDLSENISGENYDFEDIATPLRKQPDSRNRGKTVDRTIKDTSKSTAALEAQEVAESASFVNNQNNYNTGYKYQQPIYVPDEEQTNPIQPNEFATTEKEQTKKTGRKIDVSRSQTEKDYNNKDANYQKNSTVASPAAFTSRGTASYQHPNSNRGQQKNSDTKQQFLTTPNAFNANDRGSSTYVTAKRTQTSRTTPYYTPTVPTIIRKPSTTYQAPKRPSTTETTPSSEHAIEMIRTLHELNVDTSDAEKYMTVSHPGLIIPPSSGPDTLHSLALYFATAVDNLVTQNQSTTTRSTTTNKPSSTTTKSTAKTQRSYEPERKTTLPSTLSTSLLSNRTIDRYERLFGIHKVSSEREQLVSRIDQPTDTNAKLTSDDNNDLDYDYSTNPIQSAAGTPQIRELAQVFTHALSAYLHDPTTFRRVLSEIRPTEPPTLNDTNEILTNRLGRTEDFNKGSGATYLPTLPISATSSIAPPTKEDLEVLDFSDVTVSTAKKEADFPNTTPSTSTEYTSISADLETTTVFTNSLRNSVVNADRVPASRFLTDILDNGVNSQESIGTTESNNPFAMEINGALLASTSFPYLDDSRERSNNTLDDTNSYLPNYSGNKSRQNVTQPLYGSGENERYQSTTESAFVQWEDKDYTVTPDDILPLTTNSPLELAIGLLPPTPQRQGFSLPLYDSQSQINTNDNDLQHAQSQSIVASRNQIVQQQKEFQDNEKERRRNELNALTTNLPVTVSTTTEDSSVSGHYITQTLPASTIAPDFQYKYTDAPDTGKYSPNPWSTLAYTVFLDPLTINHGLMNSHDQLVTVTPSPNTYLPRTTQTTRQGKYVQPTTPQPDGDEYIEIMQKKADEMFGNLNDTSASHLMNVMKKANKNKTVRKLILLLIETCDDDYNTTVEKSRTALLNALIGMDGKIEDDSEVQVVRGGSRRRGGKSIESSAPRRNAGPTAPTETPITTFRRPISFGTSTTLASLPLFESTVTPDVETTTYRDYDQFTKSEFEEIPEDLSIYYRTSAEQQDVTSTAGYSTVDYATETTTYLPPSTTTTASTTTTTTAIPSTVAPKRRATTTKTLSQSRRISKDLDDFLGQSSQLHDPSVNRRHKNSDNRALDLLRSLYSLAGRFGKR